MRWLSTIIVLLVSSAIVQAQDGTLDKIIKAIGYVETGNIGGSHYREYPDGTMALGRFAITERYWKIVKLSSDIEGRFSQCSDDHEYAEKVVRIMMTKAQEKALINNDFEKLSKFHYYATRPADFASTEGAEEFWQDVKKYLKLK